MRRVSVILLHGAGSTGAAASALLGDCMPPSIVVRTMEDRTGNIAGLLRRLDDAAAAAELLIGVSLGAHALARWVTGRSDGPPVILCLPAWTGAPDAVAVATRDSASAVAREGKAAVLARLPSDHGTSPGRIASLVRLGWSAYDDLELVAALTMASEQWGPTSAELSAISTVCAVIGWPDDGLHPLKVAQDWAQMIPDAAYYAAESCDPIALRVSVRTAMANLVTG